eukprot:365116-Chlamydomonas_euryale.AAC.9
MKSAPWAKTSAPSHPKDHYQHAASAHLHTFTYAPRRGRPLQGDWQGIADTVAWQLHVHEFRDAANALYDMLMWNGDAMSTNPIELQLPKHCQDAPTLFRLLADYLQEFGAMLAFQASCRQHGQYFQKFSEELQNARVRTLLAEQVRAQGGQRRVQRGAGSSHRCRAGCRGLHRSMVKGVCSAGPGARTALHARPARSRTKRRKGQLQPLRCAILWNLPVCAAHHAHGVCAAHNAPRRPGVLDSEQLHPPSPIPGA